MDIKSIICNAKNRGIRNYLGIKTTGVIILVYFVAISAYIFGKEKITFAQWSQLFDNLLVQLATLVTLISIMIHGFIGIWQITTDYIKCSAVRMTAQTAISILLISYIVLGIKILLRL